MTGFGATLKKSLPCDDYSQGVFTIVTLDYDIGVSLATVGKFGERQCFAGVTGSLVADRAEILFHEGYSFLS